ncbi:MAG: hypothetical protein JW727_02220 [Candidatus Aenigmarchaeota archaeon]|nr:hypothetical protein [Candidatus Aenigmarchaeota archaeon]
MPEETVVGRTKEKYGLGASVIRAGERYLSNLADHVKYHSKAASDSVLDNETLSVGVNQTFANGIGYGAAFAVGSAAALAAYIASGGELGSFTDDLSSFFSLGTVDMVREGVFGEAEKKISHSIIAGAVAGSIANVYANGKASLALAKMGVGYKKLKEAGIYEKIAQESPLRVSKEVYESIASVSEDDKKRIDEMILRGVIKVK